MLAHVVWPSAQALRLFVLFGCPGDRFGPCAARGALDQVFNGALTGDVARNECAQFPLDVFSVVELNTVFRHGIEMLGRLMAACLNDVKNRGRCGARWDRTIGQRFSHRCSDQLSYRPLKVPSLFWKGCNTSQ